MLSDGSSKSQYMEPEIKRYNLVVPDNATPKDLVEFFRWLCQRADESFGCFNFPSVAFMKDDEYEALPFKEWFRRL